MEAEKFEIVQHLNGRWYNQHGSELTLEVDSAGRIRGEFRSHCGLATLSDACEVTGFAAGDLVAFVTDFAKFASLTSWAGHRIQEQGEERIRVCWHMTVAVPRSNGSNDVWKGVWTGEDVFRRERDPAAETERLGSHPLPQSP